SRACVSSLHQCFSLPSAPVPVSLPRGRTSPLIIAAFAPIIIAAIRHGHWPPASFTTPRYAIYST
ncbi:unnamed protein product, partial [Tilletia caries]